MIKITNLNKQIENFTLLKNINLNVKKGDIVGIVGPSGAGKSSLIRMINGLIKPSSGDIIVDNLNISSLSNNEIRLLRRKIGMVFQSFNLLNQYNVYENIRLSLIAAEIDKDLHEKIIEDLLNLVGLAARKESFPKTLSGGEKQRVAIARSLATNPKILLLDEITSALDQKTSYEILDLINNINKKYQITTVFVSHDLDAIKYLSNYVVVMDKGQIIEKNDTLELFTNPKENLTKALINKKMFDFATISSIDIYQISYLGNLANEPLIANVIKLFHVDINILYGDVININNTNVGFLYITISGLNKLQAIEYLKEKVRIIKYV